MKSFLITLLLFTSLLQISGGNSQSTSVASVTSWNVVNTEKKKKTKPFDDSFISTAPTNVQKSLIRGQVGAYLARRDGGKLHTGVDIVANQSSADKEIYSVFAVDNGKVAYAQVNGSDETGYGYTIVIDHGNNHYSQYSHLATLASSNIVKLGDQVTRGQRIAYLADLAKNEKSSGNVRADVVKQYDKIQLHFECFDATSGRTSTTSLAVIKKNYKLIDPTAKLKSFGYGTF